MAPGLALAQEGNGPLATGRACKVSHDGRCDAAAQPPRGSASIDTALLLDPPPLLERRLQPARRRHLPRSRRLWQVHGRGTRSSASRRSGDGGGGSCVAVSGSKAKARRGEGSATRWKQRGRTPPRPQLSLLPLPHCRVLQGRVQAWRGTTRLRPRRTLPLAPFPLQRRHGTTGPAEGGEGSCEHDGPRPRDSVLHLVLSMQKPKNSRGNSSGCSDSRSCSLTRRPRRVSATSGWAQQRASLSLCSSVSWM